MYRDIYDWVKRELGYSDEKIKTMKNIILNKKCSEYTAIKEMNCSEEQLIKMYKDVYRLDIFKGSTSSLNLVKQIPLNEMVEKRIIVHQKSNENVEVLLVEPKLKLDIEDLILNYYKIRGKLNFTAILEKDFNDWVRDNTDFIKSNQLNTIVEALIEENINEEEVDDEEEVDENTVIGLTDKIITDGVTFKASDIHIQPEKDTVRIRYRIDGVLKDHIEIKEKAVYKQIVNRIKIMGRMDSNNTRLPQSGKIERKIGNETVDIRVSISPKINGENVVMRILTGDVNKIRTLEELGITNSLIEKLRRMSDKTNGIIIVSGPTGSGKSSTLAALTSEINTKEKKISTIENPIEYRIDGVVQTDINEAVGLTFANTLREELRQDPDVILIGEIRDQETAQIAMEASDTGHLILTTLHTGDAVSSLDRLIRLGIDRYLVADNIIGIVGQNLIRRLCPFCKKEHIISEEDIIKFRMSKNLLGLKVYKNQGCSHCNKIGYLGRTIIIEILEVDNEIKAAVHNEDTKDKLSQIAFKNGMESKMKFAINLLKQGVTSVEEIYRLYGGVTDEESNN